MDTKHSFNFIDEKVLTRIRHENSGYFYRVTESNQEHVQYLNDFSLRIWNNKEQIGFPLHWHDATEIIIVLEDTYTVRLRNTEYVCKPGDVMIIPAGELHELLAPQSGNRLICLFDTQTLYQLNGFPTLQPFISLPEYIQRNENSYAYNRCINLLRQIVREYADKNPFYEMVIYARLLSLYVTIGRQKIGGSGQDNGYIDPKQNELNQKLSIAFEYIDSNYMENVTLEKVADIAGFSKFHFSRLFKQCSGQNFHEYLCFKRVQASEALLLVPDSSITEIAFKSGFASLSSFNRAFRAVNHCSPTEYRNLYQNRPSRNTAVPSADYSD